MNVSLYLLSILSLCFVCVNCARILCIAPMESHSHFTIAGTIFKELAQRGHEVTVISHYPQEKPLKNYKDISIKAMDSNFDDTKKRLFEMNQMSVASSLAFIIQMSGMTTETVLSHENVQELLKSNQKFDAVVMEYFMNEAHMVFSSRFEAPLILISPMPASTWTNHLVANPSSSAYIPNLLSEFGSEMTFFQRLTNTFYETAEAILRELIAIPQQQRLLKKYYPTSPPLSEIRYNTSIFLVNSHESINSAIPHVPNMIQIGGYHVKPPLELPKDLKDFMDNAREGVILFSMGSNLKSADLPVETRDGILKAFSKLKQKVLWKFEANIPNAPSNVRIMKWIPQKDLLAHPNVVCFITHGGALSTIEAVHFGVPFIGIPVFGDQMMNMARATNAGYAVSIPLDQLTEKSLSQALVQVLENPKYRNEIKRRSSIMHDRQVKPLDSAMYWIEYAIRHKGAPHLRSPALKLSWYQRSLLDIYLFISITLVIILYATMKLVSACCKSKKVATTNIRKKQR